MVGYLGREVFMNVKSINQLYRIAGFDRESQYEDFDVFSFQETYPETKDVVPMHTRSFYILYFIEDMGDGSLTHNNRTYENLKNSLIFIGPDHAFTGSRGRSLKGYSAMFNSSFTMQCAQALNIELLGFSTPMLNIIPLSNADKDIILDLFHTLQRERTHRISSAYILMAILAKAHRAYCNYESLICCNTPEHQLAYRFRMLLQEHISVQHDVSFYAQACNHSSSYFGEKIRAITGFTPKQLIIQYLIAEAKKYLTHSEKSVKEISYGLGYQDSSYFGRIFKEQTGMSPIEYRRKKSVNFQNLCHQT